MEKYKITGMSCAACSARVEKAVSGLSGVKSCSVNLLTNSMTVEGANEASIIAAVEAAGYGASRVTGGESNEKVGDVVRKKLLSRLIYSLILIVILMYVSMGHLMWNFPLPSFIAESPLAIALIQMALSLAVILINRSFYISGARALIKRSPNMDSLVSLGSFASFAWSTYLVFKIAFAKTGAHEYLHELYFESAAMILGFITLGKLLEAVAKGKTTSAIEKLIELTPKLAHVRRDGEEITIPSSEIVVGDVLLVRPGESFAVDGEVILGESLANESSLTGESVPTEKHVSSKVYQGTINVSGYLECRALKVGEDTLLGEVVKTVSDAAASKAPIGKLADRVAGIFVPVVLGLAFLTTLIWIFVNNSLGYALARGISVLVISCPCALGLATPVAIMVSSGIGAERGVLFKTAAAIEHTGKVKIAVFDKTGTLTKGELSVAEITSDGIREDELLSLFVSLEEKSEHPIAKAIVKYGEEKGAEILPVNSFRAITGHGVEGEIGGEKILSGSYKFTKGIAKISEKLEGEYSRLSEEGKTAVFLIKNGEALGLIACEDSVREDSRALITALHRMGIRAVMLSGDNEKCVRAIADKIGIREYYAEMLPTEKAKIVKKLSEEGVVAMVGDGINDAPALASADIGIAIGSGTDIAIESADVVLMNERLSSVAGAFRLGRGALLNIKENLFWAFFYNLLGIPLAAGAFIALLGWELNPMFAALAMSLSSFSVVMNALRLNLKKFFIDTSEKEKMEMLELKIRGMMCPHCEARVKSVLEAFPGVSAEVSHKKGYAKLNLPDGVSAEDLVKAVIDAGYKCEIAK